MLAANAARLRGAVGAVLPPVASGAAAGAAFELTLRPAFDALLHQAADIAGIGHDQFQSPTVRSVLTSLGGAAPMRAASPPQFASPATAGGFTLRHEVAAF